MSKAIEHFALKGKTPRAGQSIVIPAIEKAFETKNTVILEGSVGSGKSGIAMTLASWLGSSHILTPRKSLQDQYYNDFSEMSCVMKGKGGYPCLPRLFDAPPALSAGSSSGSEVFIPTDENEDYNKKDYKTVVARIQKRIPIFSSPLVGCDEGPCVSDKRIKKNCTLNDERPCPYNVALETAQGAPHVIHNVHSFFFQNKFAESFGQRDLLVIDECHDLETIVRGFLQTKVSVDNHKLQASMPGRDAPVELWVEWFLNTEGLSFDFLYKKYPDKEFPEQITRYYTDKGLWHKVESASNGSTKTSSTPEKRFAESMIKILDIYSDMDPKEYIVATADNLEKKRKEFTFTPLSLRGRPETLFLSYGKKRLLMSGTIYDKKRYCRNIGLNPDDVEFITLKSEFHHSRRPIYAYSDLMTDNSHASWEKSPEQFDKMIANIRKIMNVYKDKRGLIHAPSYSLAQQIASALNDKRILIHSASDFLDKLNLFCSDTSNNQVFISPVCQQGVDFKDDIARFQMILRVPYLNTSDEFVDHMREHDFPWYNYQSLIIFGQQIGRIVRSQEDWGHTYLLDSRFKAYLKRNKNTLQPWLLEAIKYR